MRRYEEPQSLVELQSAVNSTSKSESKSGHIAWTMESDKKVSGNDLAMWAHGYQAHRRRESPPTVPSWRSTSSYFYQPGNVDECKAFCLHDADCQSFEDYKSEANPYCVFKSANATSTHTGVDVHKVNITWVANTGKDISDPNSRVMAEMYSSSNVGSNVGQWGEDGDSYYHTSGDLSGCKEHCRNTNTCVSFVEMTSTDPPHCIFHSSSALGGSDFTDRTTYILE